MNKKGDFIPSFYMDLIFALLIVVMLVIFFIYGTYLPRLESKDTLAAKAVNSGEVQLINFLRTNDNVEKLKDLDEFKNSLKTTFDPLFGRCYNVIVNDKILLANAYLGNGFYDSEAKIPSKDGIVNVKLKVQKFYFDSKLRENCFGQFENA